MKKTLLYCVAFLIVLVMVSLGKWQLNRADEKQTIQNYVNKQAAKELDLNNNIVTKDNLFQQAFGTGVYLHEKTILIDSQVFKGVVGYHVVTPFQFIENAQIILINSGWVPAGASREIKPKTSLPKGVLNVSGRLQKPHSKPPIWNDKTELIQGGAWQYLDLDKFAKENEYDSLSPLILELEPTLEGVGGFKRKWQVYDDTWISRHKAYALQWFSLAIAFIFMCLVLELRSRKLLKSAVSSQSSSDI